MDATIWHNPRCSKSRAVLALLEGTGAKITIVEYLKHPPDAATLAALYRDAGISPRAGLRPDARIDGDDAAVLAAMAADPVVIERPIVRTARGVVIARPPERVHTIL